MGTKFVDLIIFAPSKTTHLKIAKKFEKIYNFISKDISI
jgi:hypothetical protein